MGGAQAIPINPRRTVEDDGCGAVTILRPASPQGACPEVDPPAPSVGLQPARIDFEAVEYRQSPFWGIPRIYSIGLGEAAMKQTVMWLALASLFATGATLSIVADSFGPAATAETTGSATLVEAPQPVAAASAKPAEPEVPVAMLDDVPPRPATPRPAVGSEALDRWFVAPGAPPTPRATEALLAPTPLAPATTATLALQPGQTTTAGTKPPEAAARPTRTPRDSNAQLPPKRRTANARACGSPSRFTDLLRQLNLLPRCSTRRPAA